MYHGPQDLSNVDAVCRLFDAGAQANFAARCRRGSCDVIHPPGVLIATGDLHDNPLNLAKLVQLAGMDRADADSDSVSHLLLHEVIHSDRLMNGMDFSYRALARVADLKARFPEHVHALLANHELSQIKGAGIVKDGVRVVEAFNDGVLQVFGDGAPRVNEAISRFVRSMPLALRCAHPHGLGDILCAHSLPSPGVMGRFDTTILDRELTEEDYEPRRGTAHLMVWGRGYDAEQIEDLVERWGVRLFVLGHEKAEHGSIVIPPCALVLNSDHDKGVYLPIDLADPPDALRAAMMVKPLRPPEVIED